jgi:carbon-monoxide dehydrogenase medium subunit
MKAVAYTLERPVSIDAAARQLQEGGWGFKAVAGGQSLGAMLNLRLAQPEVLVDLDGLADLRAVTETPTAISFGAMTPHAAIEDRKLPDPSRGLMPFVARSIAYRAVRNRGTVGGSLCHADPAADWVSALPLLGATLTLAGPDGQRQLPAAQFMLAAFETALSEGELLVSVSVPRRSAAARWAYRKFCRKTGEFAEAIAGLLVDAADGTERVVLGSLDGAPRVIDQAGLVAQLRDPQRRVAWLEEQDLGLDPTRHTLLAEMLRLAVEDMEIPR